VFARTVRQTGLEFRKQFDVFCLPFGKLAEEFLYGSLLRRIGGRLIKRLPVLLYPTPIS